MTTLPASRRGAAPSAVRATWLTCALDGRDHAVVDHDPESGAHLSACAKTVWASSLASPPAARCPDCDDSTGGSPRRRPGLLGRWLGRRAA
ncbi:hypothetical protein LQ327_10350 [Actinomycetospora endophytica]|uniref:Zinc finger protein n=1 Tax=Actinomycetospora endophytica TaxID=2291215 RepID=A0ABS8P773_9PSEU|nr:hypothetical protein [Actinomycetospora endophytica]MCD2193777.1 hypothetical protein [Actinomycetospora endophytica]